MIKISFKKFIKRNYTGWLFAAPLVVGLLVFTVYPVISSLMYSFFDYNMLNRSLFVGFGNYVTMFTADPEFYKAVGNTLFFSAVNVPLIMATSYVLAALLNKQTRGIGAFRVLFYLPCMIPAVAGAILWKDLFDPTLGVFNRILGAVGLGPYKFFMSDNLGAIGAMLWMNTWGIGGGMILWLAAFKNIPRELYESADIDGARRFRKLISITLPMSTPMIFFNLVTMIIASLQYNGTLIFAPRNGRGLDDALYMYGVKIYTDAFTARARVGYGSALAWVLLLFIALLVGVTFKTNKWVQYGEGEGN
ncbi:sugar ABC transporter permease [Clostridia bacterium]|nr:sugar ABC transporter permease [Clostridia bacterium]